MLINMGLNRYKRPLIVLLGLGAIGSLAIVAAGSIRHSDAASASNWIANRIIDDYNFYNGSTMSVSSIQSFLNSKVPTCDTNGSKEYYNTGMTRAEWAEANNKPEPPYICLKGYTQNIPGKSADSYCLGAVSSGNKSAARIIYDVAKACNISPKVLIVTLQKEQGLVTDDWPWPVQYEKAMGYGCPDTAPCDPDFAGFFNQVWYAARQFQRYKAQSHLFNHRAGQTSRVYYNPSTSCGYTNLKMYNHATAGLYNYTPYQPNQAALNNLYGTGNSCSAYGNRNFWRMYTDWFGSTIKTNGEIFLRHGDGSGGFNNQTAHQWAGGSHFQSFASDFDGDGNGDIALRRLSTGVIYIKYGDGSGGFNNQTAHQWAGGSHFQSFASDFDGDGNGDIALRRLK